MNLLLNTLCNPEAALDLSPAQHSELIAQGRRAGLLATLAARLLKLDGAATLNPRIKRHYDSAYLVHAKQKHDLAYELSQLKPAFDAAGERLILLKGAAYLAGNLDCGAGRLTSDIDLLTPQGSIQHVERTLIEAGWQRSEKTDYDDRYYREWMHEIPPLHHPDRGSVLDVHHTILPPTSAPDIPAGPLFESLVELKPGVCGLGPQDMLLHSVAHLMFESEFHHALRDLWDQRCLLAQFSQEDDHFWPKLVDRAQLLNLESPLWLSLRYVNRYFDLPIPGDTLKALRPGFAGLRQLYWDPLFRRVFAADQRDQLPAFHDLAHRMMYLRGHALRMPPQLLIPHLARKAWQARQGEAKPA